MAELCKKDAVAAFAVAEAERATLRESIGDVTQEVVRLSSERKTVLGVALVPTLTARSGA